MNEDRQQPPFNDAFDEPTLAVACQPSPLEWLPPDAASDLRSDDAGSDVEMTECGEPAAARATDSAATATSSLRPSGSEGSNSGGKRSSRASGSRRALESIPRRPTILPQVGDECFGFRLRLRLGRGAFAQVFLAEESDLASRPVVLKVSGIDGREPQTLAQLQHTHIVPIYSLHENVQLGLRGVCMPYFGGATLADVMKCVWDAPHQPQRGSQIAAALAKVRGPTLDDVERGATGRARHPDDVEPAALSSEGAHAAALRLYEQTTYVRAVCWIVARLAEALQHAHARGVLHRDIKPTNILLADDGQPLLLDFNLAQSRHDLQSQMAAVVGGTLGYMAPEHLRAVATRNSHLARDVDHRADIYSLGMVLHEMLVGRSLASPSAGYTPLPILMAAVADERSQKIPSARNGREDIPWSVESILRKALDPDPKRRYQNAEQLSEDVDRFLDDRPLRYAPELSRVETVRKWCRRHPRLASSASVACAATILLAIAGAGLVGVYRHLESTRSNLELARDQDRLRLFDTGATQTRCLLHTHSELRDHLALGIHRCVQTLNSYEVLTRGDWQEQPAWRRLAEAERSRLSEDVRELLILLAWAKSQQVAGDGGKKQAIALLDRAEAIVGLTPCRALWEERQRQWAALGKPMEAEAARVQAHRLRPASPRDFYLQAAGATRGKQYADAIAALNEALRLNPRHYWSLLQRGICHQELGESTLAAADFGTCIGLWPELAWGYFNRGCLFQETGKRAEAVRDYSAALDRDPHFTLALFNCGMVRLELRQYQLALGDFDSAAELRADDAGLHAGRGIALEGLGRHEEADAAFAETWRRAEHTTEAVRKRLRWAVGFAISKRLPTLAREHFHAVLQADPLNSQALYGQGMLIVEEAQTLSKEEKRVREEAALTYFQRAVNVAPQFADARRARATLLARLGMLEEATRDVNWCLERDAREGANLYTAACVAALAVPAGDAPATRMARREALDFLQRALKSGYGFEQLQNDPDLASLRDDPEFQQLVANHALNRPAAKQD